MDGKLSLEEVTRFVDGPMSENILEFAKTKGENVSAVTAMFEKGKTLVPGFFAQADADKDGLLDDRELPTLVKLREEYFDQEEAKDEAKDDADDGSTEDGAQAQGVAGVEKEDGPEDKSEAEAVV